MVASAVAAAAVGALAVHAHWNARRAERAHPPIGGFLELDGTRLHHVAAGTGPPLVMLHGAGALMEDFVLSLLPAAARRWRAHLFDRPGMGYSVPAGSRRWTPRRQARLLLRAMRRLGIRRPVVVAHSWGSLVALAMALEEPDAVAGLVLLAGYYYPRRGAEAALESLKPPVAPLLAHTVAPLAVRMAAGWLARRNFAPEPVPLAFSAGFPAEMLMRPAHIDAALRELALLRDGTAELAPHYRRVHMPVAVLAGADDRIVDSQAQSMRLAAELPDASIHLLDGAGHMIHHVRTAAVLAAIDEVARRAGPRGAA